jgi:hypothetical protein
MGHADQVEPRHLLFLCNLCVVGKLRDVLLGAKRISTELLGVFVVFMRRTNCLQHSLLYKGMNTKWEDTNIDTFGN